MKSREMTNSIIEFSKNMWHRLNEHDIFTYSASLSFYMLLSFIPLLFISVALVGELIGRRPEVIPQTIALAKEIFPFMTGRMEENIYSLIENKAIFVGIGAFTLLWSAHMVLAEGEKVIRKIFGIKKKRWLLMSHAIAWGIFLLSVVFFSLSFLFGLYLGLVKENLLPPALSNVVGPFLDSFVIKYIPPLMVTLTVTAAYKFLPQRQVPVSTAFYGGFSFAVLWEVAKKVFIIYTGSVKYVSLIYGSLTTLMFFLFFVYYSALIFIVIAEFVAGALDMRND